MDGCSNRIFIDKRSLLIKKNVIIGNYEGLNLYPSDIFDKLDENRVSHIVGLVKDDNFGQIFISDTHADRTENVVKNIHQSYKIFTL